MVKQGIGLGTSEFKKMRIQNNYYIDKTIFIKDIIDNKSEVILITRPRRFGKTLNMSMLKYYFDCAQKDSRELFEGLKIMEQGEKYTSKLGEYPCIYLTLKDIEGSSFEETLEFLGRRLTDLFTEYANLLNSKKLLDVEKEMFSTVLNFKANKIELQTALNLLSKLLYR